MKINELQKSIINKTPSNYMLWTGEELAVQDLYITKILELGYIKKSIDTVEQAIKLITKPSFTKEKSLYIITQDNEYLQQEKLWEKVEEIATKSNNILLIRYSILDKRSKFYKKYKDTMTEFETLPDNILYKYTDKMLPKLSDEEIETLIKICGKNYGRILLEIDKIKTYEKETYKTTSEALQTLLKDGTITKPLDDVTFEFVDSFLYGNVEKTIKLAHGLKKQVESPLGVLSLLYTNFRNMLLYQGLGKDKNNAEEKTGLTKWQIKSVQKNIGGYSNQELQKALETITKAEQGIKTGKIDPEVALDYVILNIL